LHLDHFEQADGRFFNMLIDLERGGDSNVMQAPSHRRGRELGTHGRQSVVEIQAILGYS